MVAMEGNSNIRLRGMDRMRLAKIRCKLGSENEQISKLYKFPNLILGSVFLDFFMESCGIVVNGDDNINSFGEKHADLKKKENEVHY